MTWFLCCVPSWFLSRPFELILSFCTQLTTFNTISPHFCIVYPTDSFQDHLAQFYHCVPSWLLSRPFDPILSLCTQLTPFKTIWPKFHWNLVCTVLFTNCFAFHWKTIVLFTEKQQKHLIQHRSLIMTWCFIEYRGNAN